MTDTTIIALFVCFTVLALAALAFWFDWSKLPTSRAMDSMQRQYDHEIHQIAMQLTKLTRRADDQLEQFNKQIEDVQAERSRYVQMNQGR